MFDFNGFGFVESGAFTGSSVTPFLLNTDSDLERRLADLDGETRKKVRKHLGEFHNVEEMERYIDLITRDKKEDRDRFS